MSAAGWFVVLLALVSANLPFVSERFFCLVALRLPVKGVAWRVAEFVALYGVVVAIGFALEARAGNRFPQGWAFYVITFCLFVVSAFPGFTWRYLVRRALS